MCKRNGEGVETVLAHGDRFDHTAGRSMFCSNTILILSTDEFTVPVLYVNFIEHNYDTKILVEVLQLSVNK